MLLFKETSHSDVPTSGFKSYTSINRCVTIKILPHGADGQYPDGLPSRDVDTKTVFVEKQKREATLLLAPPIEAFACPSIETSNETSRRMYARATRSVAERADADITYP